MCEKNIWQQKKNTYNIFLIYIYNYKNMINKVNSSVNQWKSTVADHTKNTKQDVKESVSSILDLDYSSVNPEFLEKNKKFVEVLLKTKKYTVLTNDWEVDYYSLLLVNDGEKDHIIPVQVLLEILKSEDLEDMDKKYDLACIWEKERVWEDQESKWLDLEKLREAFIRTPYYNYTYWSMWYEESFEKFYIFTSSWEEIELKWDINERSNYSHTPDYYYNWEKAIDQVIDYMAKHWPDSVLEIKLYKYYENTFYYNEDGYDWIITVKLKDVADLIEKRIPEKTKEDKEKYLKNIETVKNLLSSTPSYEEHNSSAGNSIKYERFTLVFEDWREITLNEETHISDWNNRIKDQVSDAKTVMEQIKNLISENPDVSVSKIIYNSFSDTDFWHNYDERIEVDFKDIEESIK